MSNDIFSVRELKNEIIEFIDSNKITKIGLQQCLIALKEGVIYDYEVGWKTTLVELDDVCEFMLQYEDEPNWWVRDMVYMIKDNFKEKEAINVQH